VLAVGDARRFRTPDDRIGDQRVADIYLTEFMRLFNHYRLRGKAKAPNGKPSPGPTAPRSSNRRRIHLVPDGSWAELFYVDDSSEAKERRMFSRSVV
jgi:hypothetical protein